MPHRERKIVPEELFYYYYHHHDHHHDDDDDVCGIRRSRMAMDLYFEKSLEGSGLSKGEDKLLSMQEVPLLHVTSPRH